MLLVKTKIGFSSIDGLGLFADQFIAKGTRVWQWVDGFDIRMTESDIKRLSPPALESFLRHSYLSKRTGLYVLCFDNSRFLNHSDKPNLTDIDSEDSEEGLDIAARDIFAGEELTTNYWDFDHESEIKVQYLLNNPS